MRAFLLLLSLLACHTWAQTADQVENLTVPEDVDSDTASEVVPQHPCAYKQCGDGYQCDLDEQGDAVCICLRECPILNPAVQVCTTANETFASECELLRERCLCHQQDAECRDSTHASAMLDYYGICKELPPCQDDELNEFPLRMRQWLYLVMEELDGRGDLSATAHEMLQEAQGQEHHWVLPVIWKFCELDTTHDRFVTREELLPVSAPLKPLEHCAADFLDKCDADDNGQIDITEWGQCLQLDTDEVQDRCDALKI